MVLGSLHQVLLKTWVPPLNAEPTMPNSASQTLHRRIDFPSSQALCAEGDESLEAAYLLPKP